MAHSWAGMAKLSGVVNLCGSSREKDTRLVTTQQRIPVSYFMSRCKKKQSYNKAPVLGLRVFADVAQRKMRKAQVEGGGSMEEDKDITPQAFTRPSQT